MLASLWLSGRGWNAKLECLAAAAPPGENWYETNNPEKLKFKIGSNFLSKVRFGPRQPTLISIIFHAKYFPFCKVWSLHSSDGNICVSCSGWCGNLRSVSGGSYQVTDPKLYVIDLHSAALAASVNNDCTISNYSFPSARLSNCDLGQTEPPAQHQHNITPKYSNSKAKKMQYKLIGRETVMLSLRSRHFLTGEVARLHAMLTEKTLGWLGLSEQFDKCHISLRCDSSFRWLWNHWMGRLQGGETLARAGWAGWSDRFADR